MATTTARQGEDGGCRTEPLRGWTECWAMAAAKARSGDTHHCQAPRPPTTFIGRTSPGSLRKSRPRALERTRRASTGSASSASAAAMALGRRLGRVDVGARPDGCAALAAPAIHPHPLPPRLPLRRCSDGTTVEAPVGPLVTDFGTWSTKDAACPAGTAVCAVKAKIEHSMAGDRTGMNSVEVGCCRMCANKQLVHQGNCGARVQGPRRARADCGGPRRALACAARSLARGACSGMEGWTQPCVWLRPSLLRTHALHRLPCPLPPPIPLCIARSPDLPRWHFRERRRVCHAEHHLHWHL